MSSASASVALRPQTEDEYRAGIYSLLAALLRSPPNQELLAQLRTIEAIDTTADDSADDSADDPLAQAWAGLKESADQATDPELLRDEFQTLFIGVGRGELVPYGSWYLTGFLMEKPLGELRSELTRLGLERQQQVREPEDHAAALCEVMALLISDPDFADSEQAPFFKRHIGSWMGTFFRDLEKAKTAEFYRPIGRFGYAFLDVEQRYLSFTV